jgi:glutaredoxin
VRRHRFVVKDWSFCSLDLSVSSVAKGWQRYFKTLKFGMGSYAFSVHNGGRPVVKGNACRTPSLEINAMKTLFRILRWPLGQIVILLDWLTRPSKPAHSAPRQAELDQLTASLKLYQFAQCPFCVKTRRTIRRLGLNIELRDARGDAHWRSELIQQGGRHQVPCLRLLKGDGSSRWLYESKDIIRYLEQHYG